MTTQISVNNLVSNQTIELKTSQKNVQEDVDASQSGYNVNNSNKDSSVENEKVSLFNLSKIDNKDVDANAKRFKEDELELEDAIEVIAEFMQQSTQNVNFQKDETSDKTVIKVFDTESKDLIKQFPSEEVINIAHKIIELRQDIGMKPGILLDEQV